MLYYKDLEETVLSRHRYESFDDFLVISGYIGSEPIRKLAEFPDNIHIKVVYGMYAHDSIKEPLHNAILDLQEKLPNVDILYSTIPVHSKLYIWREHEMIKNALIGSANFSVSGLCNNYKEVLADIDNDTFNELDFYYKHVLQACIPCTEHVLRSEEDLKKRLKRYENHPRVAESICRASLLGKSGDVSAKSGLNWGLSNGHVAEGDAYIAITKDYIREFPQLFPPKKYVNGLINLQSSGKANRENDEVELIWDDGTIMVGLLEGQQHDTETGLNYPKQLASAPQKSILGKYLRARLNVPLNHRITKRDLERYGRTHIDISLIGDGVYYMDFSIK